MKTLRRPFALILALAVSAACHGTADPKEDQEVTLRGDGGVAFSDGRLDDLGEGDACSTSPDNIMCDEGTHSCEGVDDKGCPSLSCCPCPTPPDQIQCVEGTHGCEGVDDKGCPSLSCCPD